MSRPASPTPQPPRRKRRFRRWLWRLAFVVAACWGLYRCTHSSPPSVMLRDGTEITLHSVSRGKPAGEEMSGERLFEHGAISNDGIARTSWVWLRDHLPSGLSKHLYDWPLRTTFNESWSRHEFELRFFAQGSWNGIPTRPAAVSIADDGGWETKFDHLKWDDGGPPYGVPSAPARLAVLCPLPRHSRLLRIRFHSWATPVVPDGIYIPGLTPASSHFAFELPTIVGEMVIPNPYYEGPAPASSAPASSASAMPVTKATRFGDITFTRLDRRRVAGSDSRVLHLQFALRNRGVNVPRLVYCLESITDRSGQSFGRSSDWPLLEGDRVKDVWVTESPWSDDPVWKIKLKLRRDIKSIPVSEEEGFEFDHLPFPTGQRIEVNRSITRNGLTFSIVAIGGLSGVGVEGLELECSPPAPAGDVRMFRVQVKWDGRKPTAFESEMSDSRLYSDSFDPKRPRAHFQIGDSPGAKWWDLKIVPETLETVEFEVRPTFVK